MNTAHAVPWVLPAAVSALAVIASLVKVGRWVSRVEERLARHQDDLEGLGKAVTALRQNDHP